MFIGYINKTIKQYKVYTLDLYTTIRSSIVNFEEETKGRIIDLNFLKEYLQGTLNVLTIWKLVRRPKEPSYLIVKLPLPKKLNNFKIVIPL